MRFAMHQPNYLPWIGYFAKIAACDTFVLLDDVQYPRGRSIASRNKVLTPQGSSWLTVPASVPKDRKGKAAYTEIGLAEPGFAKKHLKTLEMAYGRAPHKDDALSIFERVAVDGGHTMLCELNIALIEAYADYLELDASFVRLSALDGEFGHKNDLIIDIAKAIDADTYLSGDGGGHDYNDEQQLGDAGIALEYLGFTHPEYEQVWGDEFEPGMCIIDLIANTGSEAADIVRRAPAAAS